MHGGCRAAAIKKWYHTWYLRKALHLGHRDRRLLSSWQRKETSQTPDSMVMQRGLVVTRGPTSPITRASSEFPRPDGPCFRKEEPYQPSTAMFSTSGEDAGKKTKHGGGGGSEPPKVRWPGGLALRHLPKGRGWALRAGSLVLPALTQHVILSSSESQPPWIKKEIRIRSLTLEQFHVGEITWNSREEKGGNRTRERERPHGYHSFPSPTPQLCLLPNV